jgi:hypothetical protein
MWRSRVLADTMIDSGCFKKCGQHPPEIEVAIIVESFTTNGEQAELQKFNLLIVKFGTG